MSSPREPAQGLGHGDLTAGFPPLHTAHRPETQEGSGCPPSYREEHLALTPDLSGEASLPQAGLTVFPVELHVFHATAFFQASL